MVIHRFHFGSRYAVAFVGGALRDAHGMRTWAGDWFMGPLIGAETIAYA
jgi:hypothetical protein|tara:strand:+ start:92 stop:238 length:147 start_codon:yes stop_codon:yes gene_type:complete